MARATVRSGPRKKPMAGAGEVEDVAEGEVVEVGVGTEGVAESRVGGR